jgi:hypothetical protein
LFESQGVNEFGLGCGGDGLVAVAAVDHKAGKRRYLIRRTDAVTST